MKRTQLIEYGIITIGLVFAFKAFDSFFTAIIQVLYMFGGIGGAEIGPLLPTLFILVAYTVCFIVLIRKSGPIAVYLGGMSAGENVPFKIGKRSLLHVVLIGICAAIILSSLAEVLLYLFETFKQEAGRGSFTDPEGSKMNKYTFNVAAIRTIIAGVTLYFSKDVSNWFIRRNEVDELTFESESERDK